MPLTVPIGFAGRDDELRPCSGSRGWVSSASAARSRLADDVGGDLHAVGAGAVGQGDRGALLSTLVPDGRVARQHGVRLAADRCLAGELADRRARVWRIVVWRRSACTRCSGGTCTLVFGRLGVAGQQQAAGDRRGREQREQRDQQQAARRDGGAARDGAGAEAAPGAGPARAAAGWRARGGRPGCRPRSSLISAGGLVAIGGVLRQRLHDDGVDVGRQVGLEVGRRDRRPRGRADTRRRPANRPGRAAGR